MPAVRGEVLVGEEGAEFVAHLQVAVPLGEGRARDAGSLVRDGEVGLGVERHGDLGSGEGADTSIITPLPEFANSVGIHVISCHTGQKPARWSHFETSIPPVGTIHRGFNLGRELWSAWTRSGHDPCSSSLLPGRHRPMIEVRRGHIAVERAEGVREVRDALEADRVGDFADRAAPLAEQRSGVL